MPRSEQTSLAVILIGAGLLLLVLSLGDLPWELQPQLLTSFAVISLAMALRAAGDPALDSQ